MEAYDEWVSQLQSNDSPVQIRAEKQPSDALNWSQPPTSTSTSTTSTPAPTASGSRTNVVNSQPDEPDFTDLASTPSQFYNTYPSYYPSQYGVSSYAQSAWAAQSQPPLSNYSSLNGATSTLSHPHHLQHPPLSSHQGSSQSMVIDPALTTTHNNNGAMNVGTKGTPPGPYYGRQPLPFASGPPQTAPLSIDPSFIHSTDFFQNLAAAAKAQGSEPNNIYHALPPSMISNITSQNLSASTSIASPTAQASRPAPSKPAPTPEERRAQFLTTLKSLLVAKSFTGAQAVQSLVAKIEGYGPQEVDADTRKDILTKIRDGAGNHYFRAWSENLGALDITREWLKAGITAKPGSDLVDTIMPLLHIIDRLPLTVESLKTSKLGKIIVRLTKDQSNSAIKDMAFNIERRWRTMVSSSEPGSKAGSDSNEADRAKRRKLNDSSASSSAVTKAAPIVKRGTVASNGKATTTATAVKKEVASANAKGAKSDSSFFSAKPKPKLPSFKKAPPAPPVKMEGNGSAINSNNTSNIAQPSAIDPFQEVLKSLGKRKESPVSSATPPPAADAANASSLTNQLGSGKKGGKRKSVTWAPEGSLESVKIIERAVYEDDDDGMQGSHSLRDLDRDEGAALHAHLFEEAIDWSEPQLFQIPPDIDLRDRGEQSTEKGVQEQREQTALSAVYMNDSQIPDSPAEPPTTTAIPDDEIDKDAKVMITGPEVDSIFWSGPPPVPVGTTVADLVGQLGVGAGTDAMMMGMDAMQSDVAKSFAADPNVLSAMQSMPPQQIQQLVAQLTQPGSMFASLMGGAAGQQQHQQPQGYGMDQGQGHYGDYAGYGNNQGYQQQQMEDEHRGGWSGDNNGVPRGRGRGGFRGRGGRGFNRSDDGFVRRRKPCIFFQAGRCKFGDQCDFPHDLSA